MIIEFYDNDDTYGRIETDVSREKIEKIENKIYGITIKC